MEPTLLNNPLSRSETGFDNRVRYAETPGIILDGKAIVNNDLDPEFPRGTELWFKKSYLHRQGVFRNLPAVVRPDGIKEWWVNGRRHRKSRPAVTYPTGEVEYWEKGKMTKRPTIKGIKHNEDEMIKTIEYLKSIKGDPDREDVGSVSDFFEESSGKDFEPVATYSNDYVKFMNQYYPGRCFVIKGSQYYIKDMGKSMDPEVASRLSKEDRYAKSHFMEKYNPDIELITEIKDGASGIPSLESVLRNPKTTLLKSFLVAVSLEPMIMSVYKGGHANTLFVDNIYKKIYVFEPNGSMVLEVPSWKMMNKVRSDIISYVQKLLSSYGYGDYSYSFEDSCPKYGPQALEGKDATPYITKKLPGVLGAGATGGFCQSWSMMLLTYALLNPYLMYSQIFDLLINRFSPGDLSRRVDRFAGFLELVSKNPEAARRKLEGVKRKTRRILTETSECAKMIKGLNDLLALPANKGKTFQAIMSPQQALYYSANCLVPEEFKDKVARSAKEREVKAGLEKLYESASSLPTKETTIVITREFVMSANRKQLQTAAREYGIPANKSNEYIKEALLKKISS